MSDNASWEHEQKKKLFEDYRAGRITAEQFNELRNALTPPVAESFHRPQTQTLNFKLLGGLVVFFLAVIAFLLFWNSPEQTAKRFVRNIEAVNNAIDNDPKAQARARAVDIVSSLRNLKAASMMFYADYMDEINDRRIVIDTHNSVHFLMEYLDNPEKHRKGFTFVGETVAGSQHWYVGADVSQESKDVRRQLQQRAREAGLVGSDKTTPYNENSGVVFMKAR
jgi:hypothetical protein